MRILKTFLMLLTGLVLVFLIAINIALATRKPSGPDLGVRVNESGVSAGPEREARLWYMNRVLGRWSEADRCEGAQSEWQFTRRRVMFRGQTCEIRRFVPGLPMELELDHCESIRPENTERLEDRQTLTLALEGRNLDVTQLDKTYTLTHCR